MCTYEDGANLTCDDLGGSIGDICGDGVDAFGCHGLEAIFAEFFAQPVKSIVAQDLAIDPIL